MFKRRPDPYWITSEGPGRLAIVPRPESGEDLRQDLECLKGLGIDHLVSMLTVAESIELGLGTEETLCKEVGLKFHSFPITDRSVPEGVVEFSRFARSLAAEIVAGKSVGVHCRMGIGRSSILCAAILVVRGVDVGDAIDRVKIARGTSVPDTDEQLGWIRQFPAKFKNLTSLGLLLE